MLGICFVIVVYKMCLSRIFTCTDCKGNIILEIFSGDFLNDCIKNKPWSLMAEADKRCVWLLGLWS